MRIKFLLVLGCLVSVLTLAQENQTLKDLFEKVNEIDKKYETERTPSSYPFIKVEKRIEKAEEYKTVIQDLQNIKLSALDDSELISRQLMVMKLQNYNDNLEFKQYLLPFNAEGGFYSQPAFSLRTRSFKTVEDYKNYYSWLEDYKVYLLYNLDLLKRGVSEGIQRPKIIVKNNLDLLKPWLSNLQEENPLLGPLRDLETKFDSEKTKDLLAQGKNVVEDQMIPVYRQIYNYLSTTYLESAPDKPGISEITRGKEYYENRIRFFTTLDLSPDSVYNIGLKEVKRIKNEMYKIIQEVEFEGDFQQFIKFLRTDKQFYANTPEELLFYASWLSKRAEAGLPKLFSQLYELPFTVEPVPASIAPNYTAGRYVGGSMSEGQAGIYWVNTYDLPSRPLYALPALTLHEAVPGHHLGIVRASEIKDLPDFRKNYYISAYGEGWGLYSEYLGEEMGMYTTPYEWFGRYTYEMWRACRLVVDVGLHYKGWTRERAHNFLKDNTALSIHEVTTEIDRYIGWPGQAVSYKMGEIEIRKLRKEAEAELEGDFDIKEFHEKVLKNGAVTLPILQNEVYKYIKDAKSKE